MKKITLLLILGVTALLLHSQTFAQGCIAIRSNGASACMLNHTDSMPAQQWQLNVGLRYFKSFRHFSGTEENKQRLIENTEVVNHQSSLDIALTRIINNRWSVMMDVPILANTRSSLYEHGRTERHSMHSFGIGDIRVAAYRWMVDPAKARKANLQLGLGLKLPTGDYDYKDYWYNVGPNGEKELRTVDQSIQLGDGGTGISLELNSYLNFNHTIGLYQNFYYLSNPREQNGVRTYRETVSSRLANEAIMSVPDQYMARIGAVISPGVQKKWSAAAGLRLEGIPVYDLIGGSGDFRRPGYVISAEPALTYKIHGGNLFLSVPVAIVRNRTQSVTDKENSIIRGTHVQGDAAFADYLVNLGLSVSF